MAEQLQHGLKGRMNLEQARGRLAERVGIDLDEAFSWLRSYSRRRGHGLTSVAAAFLAGDLAAEDLMPHRRTES